jgi:hypothetical protein
LGKKLQRFEAGIDARIAPIEGLLHLSYRVFDAGHYVAKWDSAAFGAASGLFLTSTTD